MAQKKKRREKFTFPPWLPMAVAAALMVLVALAAVSDARNLNHAIQWRKHSADVIVTEQSFQNNLLDIQRGMRGYVTLGDTNALASFYSNVGVEPQQLKELSEFTADNSEQQKRLRKLGKAMTVLVAFDYRAIAIYRQEGFAGISKLDSTGVGRTDFDRAQDSLNKFAADEQRLLSVRTASEEDEYQNVGRLLIIGSMLTALLLLFLTYFASRELAFRRHVQEKLTETLMLQNAILRSTDYGIVATRQDGIVQTFNSGAEHLLGYSAGEVIGKATPMLWRDPEQVAEQAKNLSKKLGVPISPTFEVIAKTVQADMIDEGEWTFIRKDGSRFPALLVVTPLGNEIGDFAGYLGIFRDFSERKRIEAERERLVTELKNTLAHIKILSGLIPICAWCKKVRSDTGYWETVEQYVRGHSEARFSHGVCPSCAEKFKDEIHRANQNGEAALSKA
jgi:CHASE3 domain sensor protein